MELPPSLSRFLLEGSDPSVRVGVLQDLLDRPADDPEVATAREEIGRTGWAARILNDQQARGHWETFREQGDDLYLPKYIATNWRLLVLSDLGLTIDDPRIVRATDLLLKYWGKEDDGVFGQAGSELCVTGNTVRMMVRFGRLEEPAIGRAVEWLTETQKTDGGWHCFPSEAGTLDCWEALAAFATIPPRHRAEKVRRAIVRGAEFYLERGLLTEKDGSTYAPWHRLHYPVHYYYDLLVGLDTLTALGYGEDPRLRPALEELLAKRNPDGTWSWDAVHPDLAPDDPYHPRPPVYPFLLEHPGIPSRWATYLSLRVLLRSGVPFAR
ncbi:MAG: terpene cyclase/mutase family protein [Thermoplasmata archaeon]|nr:terpene cyclase/mutase family protein [Thermoplasmata archaeon]